VQVRPDTGEGSPALADCERMSDPKSAASSPAPEWQATFAQPGVNAKRGYDEVLVPALFGPWGSALLDELKVEPGESVLDVACGPGTVARLAAVRTGAAGSVTGCDISPPMLALARDKPAPAGGAPITYLECPAAELAVPDGAFDVVTCQHGLQFFADRPAALADMRRALRVGGRLGVLVWADISLLPPFAALHHAVGAVLGPELAERYRQGAWALPDPDILAGLAVGAGFGDVRVEPRTMPFDIEAGLDALLSTLSATGIADDLAALDPARAREFAAAAASAAAPFLVDGAIRSSATALLLLATR
jgi:SAM-dependent methyltransferase